MTASYSKDGAVVTHARLDWESLPGLRVLESFTAASAAVFAIILENDASGRVRLLWLRWDDKLGNTLDSHAICLQGVRWQLVFPLLLLLVDEYIAIV